MKHPYEDILYLPHHRSATRKKMSMLDRAAQFSPFAALNGYEASIRETQRRTESPAELETDAVVMLNEKILRLRTAEKESPQITVTCFVPDLRKQGGAYQQISGCVRKVDEKCQSLLLEDGTEIPFSRIYDLRGDIFDEKE